MIKIRKKENLSKVTSFFLEEQTTWPPKWVFFHRGKRRTFFWTSLCHLGLLSTLWTFSFVYSLRQYLLFSSLLHLTIHLPFSFSVQMILPTFLSLTVIFLLLTVFPSALSYEVNVNIRFDNNVNKSDNYNNVPSSSVSSSSSDESTNTSIHPSSFDSFASSDRGKNRRPHGSAVAVCHGDLNGLDYIGMCLLPKLCRTGTPFSGICPSPSHICYAPVADRVVTLPRTDDEWKEKHELWSRVHSKSYKGDS